MEVVNRQVGKKDRKNITHYCHNLPPNRTGHNIRVETYCHLVLSQKVSKMVEKGQKIWQKNPTQTYQILRKKNKTITHYCHNVLPNHFGHNVEVEMCQIEPKGTFKLHKPPKIPDFTKN